MLRVCTRLLLILFFVSSCLPPGQPMGQPPEGFKIQAKQASPVNPNKNNPKKMLQATSYGVVNGQFVPFTYGDEDFTTQSLVSSTACYSCRWNALNLTASYVQADYAPGGDSLNLDSPDVNNPNAPNGSSGYHFSVVPKASGTDINGIAITTRLNVYMRVEAYQGALSGVDRIESFGRYLVTGNVEFVSTDGINFVFDSSPGYESIINSTKVKDSPWCQVSNSEAKGRASGGTVVLKPLTGEAEISIQSSLPAKATIGNGCYSPTQYKYGTNTLNMTVTAQLNFTDPNPVPTPTPTPTATPTPFPTPTPSVTPSPEPTPTIFPQGSDKLCRHPNLANDVQRLQNELERLNQNLPEPVILRSSSNFRVQALPLVAGALVTGETLLFLGLNYEAIIASSRAAVAVVLSSLGDTKNEITGLKQQQAQIDKDFADAVANPNLKGKARADRLSQLRTESKEVHQKLLAAQQQEQLTEKKKHKLESEQEKIVQAGQEIAAIQTQIETECEDVEPSPSPSPSNNCDQSDINGIYEDAPYHGDTDNPIKSKRPRDGQGALANSLPNTSDPKTRVGISQGEFVVLSRTQEANPSIGRPAKFHGHVRPWAQLEDWMKTALEANRMVRTLKKGKKAKILKDNCPKK